MGFLNKSFRWRGFGRTGRQSNIKSHVDGVRGTYLHGWVFETIDPARTRCVRIVAGNHEIRVLVADRYRADLAEAGFTNPSCAFSTDLSEHAERLLREPDAELHIYDLESGVELRGSPIGLHELRIATSQAERELASTRREEHHDPQLPAGAGAGQTGPSGDESTKPSSTRTTAQRSPYDAYEKWHVLVTRPGFLEAVPPWDELADILEDLAKLNDFSGAGFIFRFLEECALVPLRPLPAKRMLDFYFHAANGLIRSGHVPKGLEVLESVLNTEPSHPDALALMASIIRHADPAEALSRVSAHSRSQGFAGNLTLILLYFDLLREHGDYAGCRGEIMRVARKNPTSELLLCLANLEDGPGRLQLFNMYLSETGLSPVENCSTGDVFSIDSIRGSALPKIGSGPMISILMTTYNSERYIRTAVDSIRAQTYQTWELIVTDDSSTDKTIDILEDLVREDARIRIIRSDKNQGTYSAKNRSLQEARGDLVTCHDSDDWSHPERLERQLQYMTSNPQLKGSVSRWVRLDENGAFSLKNWGRFAHLNTASLMFRREPVVSAIGFFDAVRVGADTEFRQRLALTFGWESVGHMPDVLCIGRLHGGSLTRAGHGAIDAHGISLVRSLYTSAWLDWHMTTRRDGAPAYVPSGHSPRKFAAPGVILASSADPAESMDADVFERLQVVPQPRCVG